MVGADKDHMWRCVSVLSHSLSISLTSHCEMGQFNKRGMTLFNVSIQQQESGRGGSESEHCGVPEGEITGRKTGIKGGQDGSRINGEQGNITQHNTTKQ